MANWSIHKYSAPQVNVEIIEPTNNKIKSAIRIEIEPSCLVCGQEIKERDLFIGYLENKLLNFYHSNCWKALKKAQRNNP